MFFKGVYILIRWHHPKCYYCICTVCNSRACPWQRRQGGACCFCNEDKRGIRPRLECDFFNHYLKKTRYRVHRIRESQELVSLYNVYYKDIIFHVLQSHFFFEDFLNFSFDSDFNFLDSSDVFDTCLEIFNSLSSSVRLEMINLYYSNYCH